MERTLRTAFTAACTAAVASTALTVTTAAPAAASETPPVTAATAAATAPAGDVATAPAAPAPATAAPAEFPRAVTNYCDMRSTVVTRWVNGYAVAIDIRNISTVPVRWRRAEIWGYGPLLAVQAWNASYSQSGQRGIFAPWPYNAIIAPGQTVTIGALYATGHPARPPELMVDCSPA